MIRLGVYVEAVAVVRPESRGEAELNVPGVREHGHDIGQGQLQLLGADGGVLRPGEVTFEAPSIHRLWLSQVRISRIKIFRLDGKATQSPKFQVRIFEPRPSIKSFHPPKYVLLTSDAFFHSLSPPMLHNCRLNFQLQDTFEPLIFYGNKWNCKT